MTETNCLKTEGRGTLREAGLPVVMKNRKNVGIFCWVRRGRYGGVLCQHDVVGVYHGQDIHHLRFVLGKILPRQERDLAGEKF